MTNEKEPLTLESATLLYQHYRQQYTLMHRRAQRAEAALLQRATEWSKGGITPPKKVQEVIHAAALHDLNNTAQLLKLTQEAAQRQNEEHHFCVLDRDAAVKALTHLIVSITGVEPVYSKDTNYMEAAVAAATSLVAAQKALNDRLAAVDAEMAKTSQLLTLLQEHLDQGDLS